MAQATFSCPFGAIHLEDRRGLSPRSDSRSSRLPPDPHTGDAFLKGLLKHPARAVQSIDSASASLPLASAEQNTVLLDENGAPGAYSRSGPS